MSRVTPSPSKEREEAWLRFKDLWVPFRKPAFALGCSIAGAGLSFLWFRGLGSTAVILWLLVAALLWATMAQGRRKLPLHPVAALKLFNTRKWLLGLFAAAAAAIAFIIAAEWVVEGASEADTGQVKITKDAIKEIVQSVTAAVGAYLTALTVTADDVDSAVGEYVKQQFSKVYSVAKPAPRIEGTPLQPMNPEIMADLLAQSPRELSKREIQFAKNSMGDFMLQEHPTIAEIDGWDAENRMKRAQKIEEHLKKYIPLRS